MPDKATGMPHEHLLHMFEDVVSSSSVLNLDHDPSLVLFHNQILASDSDIVDSKEICLENVDHITASYQSSESQRGS